MLLAEQVSGELWGTPNRVSSTNEYIGTKITWNSKESGTGYSDKCLMGLSHDFQAFFWPVWMRLGLNVNRLWF